MVDFLIGLGSRGVVLEGQRQAHLRLKFYFRSDEQVTDKIDSLSAYLAELGLTRKSRLSARSVSDEDWNRFWQMHSVALQPIGRTLLIRAPWHRVSEEHAGRTPVTIEPSMAFGTGTHETTRHCLEFLETLLGGSAAGRTFLDVGCGSGILAFAAFKMGARAVSAVDTDPVALENARRNAVLNEAEEIRFLDSIPTDVPFDLVSANIISGALIALRKTLQDAVGEGGNLILSGILDEEAEEVFAIYQAGFDRIGAENTGRWTTLLLERKIAKAVPASPLEPPS